MGMTLELNHALHVRSYPGSPRGGDTGLVIPSEDGALAILIDATGHGLSAYAIAQKARQLVQTYAHCAPDELLMHLDRGLRGTDGCAAAVVRIEGESLSFAGIGNIGVRLNQKQIHSKTGIVGQRMRTPELTRHAFPAGSCLVMHTDGVSSPSQIPLGSPNTIVHKLVESQGSLHDDASALAICWQDKTPLC